MHLIAYFRGRVSESKGTPLRCRNLTSWLFRQPGIDGLLVSRDSREEIAEALPGLPHHPVMRPGDGEFQLRAAIGAFKPDVVYAHTHKGMTDLAHIESGSFLRVVDLHGDLPAWRLEHNWRSPIWRAYWFLRGRWQERHDLPRIDAFTVVSAPLEKRIRALGKPVLRLWGGVDPELFQVDTMPARSEIEVTYAGNFNPYHGVITVIEAAQIALEKDGRFRLRLVGAIDQYPEVEELARAALGSHVECTGLVPYSEVPGILSEADILVIPRTPSRTALTTYPSKLSEYLATGRPVIASAVGETREVIQHRKNGLLVEPESAEAMAAAMVSLTDPVLRQNIGTSGRITACRDLSWQRVAERSIAFIRKTLDGRDRRRSLEGPQTR